MRQELDEIWDILKKHNKRLKGLTLRTLLKKLFKYKARWDVWPTQYASLHLALCVDTRDPFKQNRIRFFSPTLHLKPDQNNTGRYTRLGLLPWAWPISSMGGFDDCGMTWVPPPGTTVAILFQNGDVNTPYYIGTTWQRNKGPENAHAWGYDIPEYRKIWQGHRKGYMIGKNDESQHKPPFDTDNYQGFDFDSTVDVGLVAGLTDKTTYPHRYGFKTPEKHMVSMDDGDPKCNRRWKRLEIMSSMGHYFLMKDDPYHRCGEWVNPKCKISHVYIQPDICVPSFISTYPSMLSGIPELIAQPYPCEQGEENCDFIAGTSLTPVEWEYQGTEHLCPWFDPMTSISATASAVADCWGVLRGATDFCFSFDNSGKNKYHKHKQECFPFLNNRCALPQSGMQLLTRSGHTWVGDDSVEQPRDRPTWERAMEPFDMDGCTGVYRGRTFWRSATGHFIELNDQEINPKQRGPNNGITIQSACGNSINLNDHTGLSCTAGELRGIHVRSTADHSLDMVDDGNQQCSPERDGCGKPGAYSKKAFVRLRSGYGLQLLMNDANDQQKTDQQYIQLMAPQRDNLQRGPHILHMQERPDGPGQIFLRAGGDYVVYSYDDMVEVVGDASENPSDKLEFVSHMKVVSVKDVYYNRAKTHCFWADDYILLMAGKDCALDDATSGGQAPEEKGPDAKGTCVYPVVVAYNGIPEYVMAQCGIKASEHVFASALREPIDPCEGIASDL